MAKEKGERGLEPEAGEEKRGGRGIIAIILREDGRGGAPRADFRSLRETEFGATEV